MFPIHQVPGHGFHVLSISWAIQHIYSWEWHTAWCTKWCNPFTSSLPPVPCPQFPVPLRSLWLKLFRFKLIEGDEQVVQGFLSKRTRGRNLFLGKPYLPINHVHVYPCPSGSQTRGAVVPCDLKILPRVKGKGTNTTMHKMRPTTLISLFEPMKGSLPQVNTQQSRLLLT